MWTHVDTWGPYKVCTRGKYRYFLTLVDDFSRVTWVYLLQNKSDYSGTIAMFLSYVRNQFKTNIKIIRSDNALEFTDKICKEFYAVNGIVHQTSCNYRPQKNARVERKHRQILEVARALKFQSGLPISHWGECVLTAVHIINRLPTTALQNQIPYEVLFKKPVNYEELKTFGCLAFSCNPSHSGDKFLPRGVPCVFLGYPPTQKGFRLLNLLSKEIFVSRDVAFHEDIFPFNTHQSEKYMHPLPSLVATSRPPIFDDDFHMSFSPANDDATEAEDNNEPEPLEHEETQPLTSDIQVLR